MNICVFCSGQEVDEKYEKAAEELGRLIGSRGHTLVWGGSNGGLMRTIADSVQKAGGKIVGISVEFLRAKARKGADEMIFANDLPERKRLLRERSDAIIVLPGGTGTLDEISEILELKKHELPKFDFEIHIDVGENGPTQQLIQDVVSLVRANNFEAKTKPESYAATNVADRHV